jgi:hypothetical protein
MDVLRSSLDVVQVMPEMALRLDYVKAVNCVQPAEILK